MRNFSITSVSVTPGHPDKLCDRISDAVVDAFLRLDAQARLEVEAALSAGVAFCACHAASEAGIDIADVARRVIADTGYASAELDHGSMPVVVSLSRLPRAAERRLGTVRVPSHNVTTFGYATSATPSGLPLPIHLAHRLVRALPCGSAAASVDGVPRLHPDAQVQVMARFEDRRAVAVDSVTFLLDRLDGAGGPAEDLESGLRESIMAPVLAELPFVVEAPAVLVNPQGARAGAGPRRHAGVTGRKLGVDTYGDFAHQPSSALSGKDPGRIDRIATYAARYAARNVVAAGLAGECEVALCYRVGQARPVSVEVDTFGSGSLDDAVIGERLRRTLDLSPDAIEERFRLRALASGSADGFFEPLACYGQLGRMDLVLPWERTDLAQALSAGGPG